MLSRARRTRLSSLVEMVRFPSDPHRLSPAEWEVERDEAPDAEPLNVDRIQALVSGSRIAANHLYTAAVQANPKRFRAEMVFLASHLAALTQELLASDQWTSTDRFLRDIQRLSREEVTFRAVTGYAPDTLSPATAVSDLVDALRSFRVGNYLEDAEMRAMWDDAVTVLLRFAEVLRISYASLDAEGRRRLSTLPALADVERELRELTAVLVARLRDR